MDGQGPLTKSTEGKQWSGAVPHVIRRITWNPIELSRSQEEK